MARKADANRKKFVRYKEGAELYSMCQSKFERMAKEAKAIYKVDKVVLVNCDIFEEYLETSKSCGKDKITVFGEVVDWRDDGTSKIKGFNTLFDF